MDLNDPQTPPKRSTASALLAKFLPGVKTEHKNNSPKSVQPPSANGWDDTIIVHTPENPGPHRSRSAKKEDAPIEFTSGRKLRERKPNMSLRALENGELQRQKSQASRRKKNASSDRVTADLSSMNLTPVVSDRVAIRQQIASTTAGNRNRFLIDKKEFWLPLLPEHNYIRKLVEKHERLSDEEKSKVGRPQIALPFFLFFQEHSISA